MATQRGVFGNVQIMDIMRVINVHKKTGVMRMTSKDETVTGYLYIHQGEIIHATSGKTAGEDAAYDLLGASMEAGATFSFDCPNPSASLKPRTIERSWEDLVLQSGKVVDTKRRVFASFPDPKAVPYFVEDLATAKARGVKLHDEDKTVATAIDGRLDFSELTDATGMHQLMVLQTACILKDASLIATVNPLAKGKVARRKSFLLKSKHVLLPAKLETWWKEMPPYAKSPLKRLYIITASGVRHELENVQFDAKLKIDDFLFPEEMLARLGITDGDEVWLKPA